MKRTMLVIGLLVLAVAVASGFLLKERKSPPMSVRLNVADLQEHGLTIIGSGDTSFDGMLDVLRVNTSGAPLEAIRPYSVFIKNTGRRAVVAFVLKWELIRPDGRVIAETNQYVTKYSLMGDEVSDSGGHIIKPNTSWWAFPGFAVAQDTSGLNTGSPEFAAYLERANRDLAQYTGITVSIDGVFFEDGAFVGPDTTEFFGKVKALIDASQDLRRDIETRVKSGKSADEVLTHVTEEARKSKVKLGRNSTAEDYYKHFKRSAAEELLNMRSVSGNEKTLEHALRPSKKTRPLLRKE